MFVGEKCWFLTAYVCNLKGSMLYFKLILVFWVNEAMLNFFLVVPAYGLQWSVDDLGHVLQWNMVSCGRIYANFWGTKNQEMSLRLLFGSIYYDSSLEDLPHAYLFSPSSLTVYVICAINLCSYVVSSGSLIWTYAINLCSYDSSLEDLPHAYLWSFKWFFDSWLCYFLCLHAVMYPMTVWSADDCICTWTVKIWKQLSMFSFMEIQ